MNKAAGWHVYTPTMPLSSILLVVSLDDNVNVIIWVVG